jgi:hypothetical protein
LIPIASTSSTTRLAGWPLTLARLAWLVLSVTTLALASALVPRSYAELASLCAQPPCILEASPDLLLALRPLGISPGARAAVVIAGMVVTIAVYSAVGVAIFALRSDDWMAIFTSLVLITFGTATTVAFPASRLDGALRAPALLIEAVLLASLVLALCIFPDGRFVPRWSRWLAAVWVGWIALSYLVPAAPFSVLRMNEAQFLLFRLAWYSAGIVAQLQRYRRFATAEQRQQTKWVLFGIVAAMLVFFGLELPVALVPELRGNEPAAVLYRLARLPVSALGLLLIPLATAVSLLRYRLWDVDVLINRALLYSSLTVVLALIYLTAVTLAQVTFRALTGQESDLAVVLSTLALAGLLHPLRARLQRFIDQRFYRRKYDAERVLARFTAAVRDELDMERLTPALLAAVKETVEPAHVSLWQPARRARDAD